MNIWLLTLWIVFKAADGGMTVQVDFSMEPGTNRAVCEEFYHTTKQQMMLHGIPEINEDGERIILYPAKIAGRCELG